MGAWILFILQTICTIVKKIKKNNKKKILQTSFEKWDNNLMPLNLLWCQFITRHICSRWYTPDLEVVTIRHVSICLTVARKVISWRKGNLCQVPEARMLLLASYWGFLQSACHQGASEDVSRDGNYWAREAPGWQEVTEANVKQAVTCCRTDTIHWFIGRRDTRVYAMMGQMLEYQWWPRGGMTCTVWYLCLLFVSKWE